MDSATAIKLVVCLGNPGSAYAATRHNAGWMAGDALRAMAEEMPLPPAVKPVPNGLLWNLRLGSSEALMLKPTTYMNASGEAVAALMKEFPLSPREILAVSDDLDRPCGTMRLRAQGSSGGHRGLQSLIDNLQSQEFPRLRIGIGRPEPGGDVSIVDYVLGPWVSADGSSVQPILDAAAAVLKEALCGSFDHAAEMAGRCGRPADKSMPKSGENNRVQV